MNGTWYSWEGDPPAYRQMWRRVHDKIMGTSLTRSHVQFIWSPNNYGNGNYTADEYYPGDRYVDWLGIDGYNFGDTESWSNWTGPEATYQHMLDINRSINPSKPICIPEFASTSYINGHYDVHRKAVWIDKVYDYFRNHNIKMACWFNIQKETDWPVFGGVRGQGTFTDNDGDTYYIYGGYQNTMQESDILHADKSNPRVLNNNEFQGDF
jgi:mannan endo-1,4-beta-mannosidase